MNTGEMELIKFSGGEMEATIGPDGQPFVNIKMVCKELGINPDSQYKKLKTKPWATIVMITVVASDGKEREMLCLNHRAVPMWAATINASKIKPELRARLTAYQVEAADVLAQHFMPKKQEVTISPASGNTLARLASVQEMVTVALKVGQELAQVAINHEERLQVLEAKPVITIKTTKIGERKRLLTRWIARFKEVTGPMTEYLGQEEKREFFVEVNSGLKRIFGAKENWPPEKFYEASRWLYRNYRIDITDIEEE